MTFVPEIQNENVNVQLLMIDILHERQWHIEKFFSEHPLFVRVQTWYLSKGTHCIF